MCNAIQKLASDPTDNDALQKLETKVASASQTGHGEQQDNLIDWLANGDYDGTETVESLAAEWDADRD